MPKTLEKKKVLNGKGMVIRRRAQEITSINWGAKKDDFKVEKVVD